MENDKTDSAEGVAPLPDLQKINDLNQLLKLVEEAARAVEAQVEDLQTAVNHCAALALEEERQKLGGVAQEIARKSKYESN